MMQVSKKIPLENPDVLNIVRGVYLLSNAIIASLLYYVYIKINAKKGTSVEWHRRRRMAMRRGDAS
jgi:phosphate transporter Pho88